MGCGGVCLRSPPSLPGTLSPQFAVNVCCEAKQAGVLEPHRAWLPGLAVTFYVTGGPECPLSLVCSSVQRAWPLRTQPGSWAAVLRLASRWQCWASRGRCPGRGLRPLGAQAPPPGIQDESGGHTGHQGLATCAGATQDPMAGPLRCGQTRVSDNMFVWREGPKSQPAWSSPPPPTRPRLCGLRIGTTWRPCRGPVAQTQHGGDCRV